MGWVKGLAGAAVAALLGGCAATPAAMPSVGFAIPDESRVAAQPAGFVSFCERFADQCRATPGGSPRIALTPQTWLLLNAVNLRINDSIWPEDDFKHYGRAEYWTIPTDGYGDCDDYAVTKRHDLLQAGLPAQALRLAVVDSEASGRHAVLTVATDKGDFVLDNLTSDIKSWRATNYIWIERQDAANPMKWVSLNPIYMAEQQGGQPIVTGNTPTMGSASGAIASNATP